jgi:acetyltransferase-like isoleucine patch superfamily enzyme
MGNLIKTYFQKIRKYRFSEALYLTWGYVKGYCFSFLFEKRSLVCVLGKFRLIKKNGVMRIGNYVKFWPRVKISCCGVQNKAVCEIGNWSTIGDRTEIHIGEQVHIGQNVRISWDCVIMDRDYHTLDGTDEKTQPVRIEDNVWIGCRSIILKGVTIGQHAVVGAGSVVTKSVEPDTIVAGNPAKVIRSIEV